MKRVVRPILLGLLLAAAPAAGASLASAATADQQPARPAAVASGPDARLDLNLATRDQLVALPGIGPATADAILARRKSVGAFARVEELLEVRGIGEKRLAELRSLLVVASPAPPPGPGK